VKTPNKDRPDDAPEPLPNTDSGPAQLAPPAAPQMSARSSSQLKALNDLDEPGFDHTRPSELFSKLDLPKVVLSKPTATANQNEPAPARDAERQSRSDPGAAQDGAASVLVAAAPEPNVSTRVNTHVAPEVWFDITLDIPGGTSAPLDPRKRLAWRFDAAFAAYNLLLPTSPTTEARDVMMNVMRGYEKRLRSAAGPPREGAPQTSEALHGLLTDKQTQELELAMSELEVALLTLDECLPNDQFRTRFSKQHVAPKLLLQYARFLASCDFGIGYRRDRFELLAQELLTAKLPSGKLQLTSRKRAAELLPPLLRGLTRPAESSAARAGQISYLCDALDRLQNLTRAQQFFDSGFYLDVCGYKISAHQHITSPEFLYLCIAINVEVHNRLLGWSQAASDPRKPSSGSLAALQVQLRAQQEAAQAVFPDFHQPIGANGEQGRAKKKTAKRASKPWIGAGSSVLRLSAAAVLVLGALAANLYAFGFMQLGRPPEVLGPERVQALSPLLLTGRLTQRGKRFVGTIARPTWNRMTKRQRQDAAETLARALAAQGIDHAEVLAYQTRAIQVDFGSVVFVEDGK
jgi:hypothetical protein